MVKVRHMVTGMRMDESATLQKHTGFATRQAILDHLESLFDDRMNFGNYGRHGWHVGHRIPRSAYDRCNPIDVRRCWDPANIFPQWGKENISLGATLPDSSTLLGLRRLWPTAWNDTLP
jgi:hypothetical protein